jgi:hypothetical protein
MHVPKMPPPIVAADRAAKPPNKEQLPVAELLAIEEQTLQALAKAVAAGDRVDIRPLNIPPALQILLAEIRSSFDFLPDLLASAGGVAPESLTQTSHQIVELVLQSVPDDASDAAAWTAALIRAETSLQIGLQRAIDTVSAWRDVSPAVMDAVKESVNLVLLVLSDEQPNPLWLRPEWLGLAPRLERFRRRRRAVRQAARRRLTDPDYSTGSLDDYDEQRP